MIISASLSMLTSAAPPLFIFVTKLNSAKRREREGAADVNINRVTEIAICNLQLEFRPPFLCIRIQKKMRILLLCHSIQGLDIDWLTQNLKFSWVRSVIAIRCQLGFAGKGYFSRGKGEQGLS